MINSRVITTIFNAISCRKLLLFTSVFLAANSSHAGEWIKASSEHGVGYKAAYAFDGNVKTRWTNKQHGEDGWISYDFGRPVSFQTMTLQWEIAFALEYSIQSSDNGKDWTDVYQQKSGEGGKEELKELNFKGRYLRILCTKSGPEGFYSIWEVSIPELSTIFEEHRLLAEKTLREKLKKKVDKLGFEELVFAARQDSKDHIWGHWYANFAYYCLDPQYKNYGKLGRLCRYNIKTGDLTTLVSDPGGTVRDPQVHYDGQKILFSWRKAGSEHFHLYEINIDGTDLKQLTEGNFADIEPTYLPDGGIMFVSSRCNRWVNCWQVPVATIYRCDGDGSNIRAISANIEHDNTPWVLPNGRILYTRWEYVDRSQLAFHHLWVMNPDGTGQMVYYGNMNPGNVFIDAKPIPGTKDVMMSCSPGHGAAEHAGPVATVSVANGPDDISALKFINTGLFRDPYPLSAKTAIAAQGNAVYYIDGSEKLSLFTLPEEFGNASLHEPRPLRQREREPVIHSGLNLQKTTGALVLNDVYEGRNMKGINKGEIKKLLVLETLPKPVQFTGSMEPLTWGGGFTLERVIGTVPVEEDGSAFLELPSNRPLLFVALDENDSSVKRMQSFLTVMPGEVVSCVGCHENRVSNPIPSSGGLMALRRAPSVPAPVQGVPTVIDFPRDIQPILDKHCVECHNSENYKGGVLLTGDRGPIYSHSYFSLKAKGEYVMGRNLARGNYAPRMIGDSASPLMKRVSGEHHNVKLSEKEIKLLRYWINTGATYPGTYAALGTGSIGLNEGHLVTDQSDLELPGVQAMKKVIETRCASCHQGEKRLATHPSYVHVNAWEVGERTWKTNFMRDIIYNLTSPEKSLVLLAPLANKAGGHGTCAKDENGKPAGEHQLFFKNKNDPDYQTILKGIKEAAELLNKRKRFDMAGFKPRKEYVREMKKYGVLPASFDLSKNKIDVYAVDRRYWESLWYYPEGAKKPHLYNNPFPEELKETPQITQKQSSRRFICADYGAQKIKEFDKDGRMVWEHPAGTCTDVTKLPNGNVLFATGSEVLEVTALAHKVVFRYESQGEVTTCQRLANGNTLIGESQPLRLAEIDPSGKVVNTIPLQCNKAGHWALRHARKTPQGTYLVGHLGDCLAREYDESGKIIRDFNAPGHVFMGQRLANGNTLVSWQKGVREFDERGKLVWELTEKDVPEMNLQFVLGVDRLDNGNTMVCNWLGWEGKGQAVPLFEVTKDKKVVWHVPDNNNIGSITYMKEIGNP